MVNKLVPVVLVFVLLIIVVPYVVLESMMIVVLEVEEAEEAVVEAEADQEAEVGAEVVRVVTVQDIPEVAAGAGQEVVAEVVLMDTTGGIVNMVEVTDVVLMEKWPLLL